MATNATPKVDNDDSARGNKRIKLIQSEVEAAASKASQDFYITSLTANYNKQLEAMEQDHGEQIQEIQDLKSQLAARDRIKTEDSVKEQKTAEAAEHHREQLGVMRQAIKKQIDDIRNLELQLATSTESKRTGERENERKVADAAKVAKASRTRAISLETDLAESRKSCVALRKQKAIVEVKLINLQHSTDDQLRSQLDAARKTYKAKLESARDDQNGWIQIGFRKKYVWAGLIGENLAVRRRSATFRELAKLALKTDGLSGRSFEYENHIMPTADYSKTLAEVSSVLSAPETRG